MVSANGKFPAGSVSVVIADEGGLVEGSEQQVKSVDKCPDKLAKIFYGLKVEMIGRVKKVIAGKLNSSSKSSHQSASYLHNKKHSRESSKYVHKEYESSTNIPHNEISRFSAIQLKQAMIGKYSKTETNFIQSGNKKNVMKLKGEDVDDNFENDSQYVRKWDSNQKSRNSSNSKNNSDYRFYTMKNEEDFGRNRIKMDLKQVNIQLMQMKEKNREIERKQRQQKQQIKELKDQIQRNKNKIVSLQVQGGEQKMQIGDKQRVIMQLQQELGRLRENMDEQRMNSNMQQKRIEYKENTLNDQFKKINDKYQQSEYDRLKLVKQMNDKLNEFEILEQKSLLQFRQKEKNFVEEKNKLMKKIQNLLYEITCLKQGNLNLKGEVEELRSSQRNTNKTKTEAENELISMNSRYQAVVVDFKKKEAELVGHMTENKELRVQNQRLLAIEHKYHEICLQNVVFKQSDIKSQKKVESLTKVQMDLQSRLNEVLNSKQLFMSKNTELLKQLQIVKKMNEQKDYQINKLKQQNSGMMDRMQQSKNRMNISKQILEQDNKKMQDELKLVYKIKQSLKNDYDDTKWKLERSQELCEGYRTKIAEFNDRNLRHERDLIGKQERIKILGQANKQYESSLKILNEEIRQLGERQKGLMVEIRGKGEEISNYVNVVKQKEIEIEILSRRENELKVVIREYKETMEGMGRDKDQIDARYLREMEQIRGEGVELRGQVERMGVELKRCKQESSSYRNANRDKELMLGEMANQIANHKQSISQLQKSVQESELKIQQERKVRQKKQQELLLMKRSIESMKEQYKKGIQRFVEQMCKEMQNENEKVTYEISRVWDGINDEYVLGLQMQAMRSKLQRQLKSRQAIGVLEQTNKCLTVELQRMKSMLLLKEEGKEKQIKELRQEYSRIIDRIQQENHSISNRMIENVGAVSVVEKEKEGLLRDNQNIRAIVEEYKNTIQEMTRQKQGLILENQRLQEGRRELQRGLERQRRQREGTREYRDKQEKIEAYRQNVRQLQTKIMRLQERGEEIERDRRLNQDRVDQNNGVIQELERKGLEIQDSLFLEISKGKNKDSVIKGLESKLVDLENRNKGYVKELSQRDKSIKELHKQMVNEKQSSDRYLKRIGQLQQQIKGYEQKIQQLQNNMNRQKQQNRNTKYEYIKQIKQLKQKIIQVQSEIQINKFVIGQVQNNYVQCKNNLGDMVKELENKKKEIYGMDLEMGGLKNENLGYKQRIKEYESLNERLYEQIDNYKNKILCFEHENIDSFMKDNLIAEKEKEIQKMTNDMLALQDKYHGVRKELKSVTTQLANESLLRKNNEEQLSHKIQKLQKEVENKRYHHSSQNQKQMEFLSIERNEILSDLECVEIENDRLNSILENLKQQYQKQLQSLNQECAEMAGLLAQKQELLNTRNERICECESKIKILTNEFKICMQTWQNQKKQQEELKTKKNQGHISKIVNEVNSRSMNLLNNFNTSVTFN